MVHATLRRVHSASGLFPLAAYLLFHAWEHWPVGEGRDALFARLERSTSVAIECALVLLPLLLHGAVGLWIARRPDPERVYADERYRRLQAVTGALAGAFVVFHVCTAWLPRVLDPNPLGAAYGAMMDRSGTMSGLVLHAVGLAAVCTHLGQGLGAALPRLFPEHIEPRPARWLGGALALSLWLAFLNELASYATYAPLL